MFRAIPGSLVLYPSDAVSGEKAVEIAANYKGLVYIRTTRAATPVVYANDAEFKVGEAKVHPKEDAKATIVAGGITFDEGNAYYVLI